MLSPSPCHGLVRSLALVQALQPPDTTNTLLKPRLVSSRATGKGGQGCRAQPSVSALGKARQQGCARGQLARSEAGSWSAACHVRRAASTDTEGLSSPGLPLAAPAPERHALPCSPALAVSPLWSSRYSVWPRFSCFRAASSTAVSCQVRAGCWAVSEGEGTVGLRWEQGAVSHMAADHPDQKQRTKFSPPPPPRWSCAAAPPVGHRPPPQTPAQRTWLRQGQRGAMGISSQHRPMCRQPMRQEADGMHAPRPPQGESSSLRGSHPAAPPITPSPPSTHPCRAAGARHSPPSRPRCGCQSGCCRSATLAHQRRCWG